MAKYLSEAGLAHLWTDILKPLFESKVDKVTGKGLSSLDFTQTYANQIGAAGDAVTTLNSVKVDKVSGKGLSTNDFTTAYKNLIDQNASDILAKATGSTTTCTLPASGWSGSGPYTYAATAAGVTATNLVLAGPAPASKAVYDDCGAYPSTQGADTLTFTAESMPSEAITVNVAVFEL